MSEDPVEKYLKDIDEVRGCRGERPGISCVRFDGKLVVLGIHRPFVKPAELFKTRPLHQHKHAGSMRPEHPRPALGYVVETIQQVVRKATF